MGDNAIFLHMIAQKQKTPKVENCHAGTANVLWQDHICQTMAVKYTVKDTACSEHVTPAMCHYCHVSLPLPDRLQQLLYAASTGKAVYIM